MNRTETRTEARAASEAADAAWDVLDDLANAAHAAVVAFDAEIAWHCRTPEQNGRAIGLKAAYDSLLNAKIRAENHLNTVWVPA
jgi:hypothetical protein